LIKKKPDSCNTGERERSPSHAIKEKRQDLGIIEEGRPESKLARQTRKAQWEKEVALPRRVTRKKPGENVTSEKKNWEGPR